MRWGLRVHGVALAVPARRWLAFRFPPAGDQRRHLRYHRRDAARLRLGARRRHRWRHIMADINLPGQQDREIPATSEEGNPDGRAPRRGRRSSGTYGDRWPVTRALLEDRTHRWVVLSGLVTKHGTAGRCHVSTTLSI